MHSLKNDFPEVSSIKVVVEERRIDLETSPRNWRTHQYQGFAELPPRIRPAFASPGTAADLDLAELVREACRAGGGESRFEAPYQNGTGGDKKTILRTVTIRVRFRKQRHPG